MLTNLTLLITAIVLYVFWLPWGVLVTLLNAVREGSIKKVVAYLSHSGLAIAISIDTLGNVTCRDLLNGLCRKNGGYDFGDYRDTISKVLGKNKAMGTLTDTGRALANLLNWIQKDHVENAAKN